METEVYISILHYKRRLPAIFFSYTQATMSTWKYRLELQCSLFVDAIQRY